MSLCDQTKYDNSIITCSQGLKFTELSPFNTVLLYSLKEIVEYVSFNQSAVNP